MIKPQTLNTYTMPPRDLIVSSINHHHTPQEQRGTWAWNSMQQKIILQQLLSTQIIDEALILCTCNRTEIICLTTQPEISKKHLDSIIPPPHRVFKKNRDAIAHILRTLCGLESQCIGENEILGQYRQAQKNAYAHQINQKHLLKTLNQLHHKAKNIREESGINQHSTCLAKHVIVELKQHLAHIPSPKILFIGAGDTIQQHLEHLQRQNITFQGAIACRHPEDNQHIAKKYQVKLAHIDHIEHLLQNHDCVISATKCPIPIIDHKKFHKISKTPQLMVDLAVPRDINWPSDQHTRIITLDDLNQARQVPQTIITNAINLSIYHATQCFHAFLVIQHSDQIIAFREHWLQLSQKIISSSQSSNLIAQTLYRHMHMIHKILNIPPPVNLAHSHQHDLHRYAIQLAHQPTMTLKKAIGHAYINSSKLKRIIHYCKLQSNNATTLSVTATS